MYELSVTMHVKQDIASKRGSKIDKLFSFIKVDPFKVIFEYQQTDRNVCRLSTVV